VSGAAFRGSVIRVSATIRETLPSSIVLSNLLPQCKLLFTEKLSDLSGRDFLMNLTHFLDKIVAISGDRQAMFESIQGFHSSDLFPRKTHDGSSRAGPVAHAENSSSANDRSDLAQPQSCRPSAITSRYLLLENGLALTRVEDCVQNHSRHYRPCRRSLHRTERHRACLLGLSGAHLTPVSDFLSACSDYRWLPPEILQYLLRPLVKCASGFATLFDHVFAFLFLQYRNTTQLRLILDVDDETSTWNDMLVPRSLMATFDRVQPGFPAVTCQRTGYIIVRLFRFGECGFGDVLRLIKSDDEAVYTAMSIMRGSAELQGESVFDGAVPGSDDQRDSNAWQLFLFEDALTSKLAGDH
jgi:hypothetical protein